MVSGFTRKSNRYDLHANREHPSIRQCHTSSPTLEDGDAKFLLQREHVPAERAWRNEEPLCSLTKRTCGSDLAEIPELGGVNHRRWLSRCATRRGVHSRISAIKWIRRGADYFKQMRDPALASGCRRLRSEGRPPADLRAAAACKRVCRSSPCTHRIRPALAQGPKPLIREGDVSDQGSGH